MSMKSMTTMPPMSRRRSCLAISSAASRLLRNTVSSRFDVPTFLPVLTSMTVSASVCSMISEPPLRQPHLAVERLVQLLVDVVALEQRQAVGGRVVELDAVGELGVERGDVVLDVVVQALVVDDDAAVLGVELLADDPHGQLGLAVQQRRAVGLAWPWPRSRSTGRAGGVMSARSSCSVACSAAVRTIRPCSAGLTRSRMLRRRLRTSSGRRLEMP